MGVRREKKTFLATAHPNVRSVKDNANVSRARAREGEEVAIEFNRVRCGSWGRFDGSVFDTEQPIYLRSRKLMT